MSAHALQAAHPRALPTAVISDLDAQLIKLESAPSSDLFNQLLGRLTALHPTYGQDPAFQSLVSRLTATRDRIEVQTPNAAQTPSLAGKAVQPVALSLENICERLGALSQLSDALLANNMKALRSEYEALVQAFELLPNDVKNGNDPLVQGVKTAFTGIHHILTAPADPKPFFSPSVANKLVTVLNMAANYYHEHAFLPAMVWGAGIQLVMAKAQAEPITEHTVLKGAAKGTGVAFVNRYLDGAAFSLKSAIMAGVLEVKKHSHPAIADASKTLETMITVESTVSLGKNLWTNPVGTVWSMVKVMAVVTGVVYLAGRMGVQLPQNQNP